MEQIIDININGKNKLHYCKLGNIKVKKGITIIVRDDKSLFFAKVVNDDFKINSKKITSTIYDFVRIATKKDYQIYKNNEVEANKALVRCKKLVKKYNLNMNVISAEFTFNKNQLYFNFTSDTRVDFRDLVKELADIYKTRIELRQIGVRDKAKEVGGCGQCGRGLCCSKFLNDFDSVSINMAKNQNISLNPNKINGVCGRLLCCLKYEDDCYSQLRKKLPCLGSMVNTDEGIGRVVAVDLLKQTYRVDVGEKGIIDCEVKDESN